MNIFHFSLFLYIQGFPITSINLTRIVLPLSLPLYKGITLIHLNRIVFEGEREGTEE